MSVVALSMSKVMWLVKGARNCVVVAAKARPWIPMHQVKPVFIICNYVYLQLIMYLICLLQFSSVTQSIANPIHILVDETDCSYTFGCQGNPMNPKYLIQKTQIPNPVYFLLFN